MSDPGALPELAWLPVDKLDVDPAYQRTLDTKASQKLIQKIADGFRWISFQAILATPVGQGDKKRWLIIDGQHRLAAAKQVGIPHVPAVVVAEASQQEQAAAFVVANKDRVPVSAQAIYYARLAAGEAEALTVARICKAAHVEMLRYPLAASKTPARKTTAISALLRLLKDHPEERVTAAVCALSEAFPHDIAGIRSPFIMAGVRFLQEGGNSDELLAALKSVGVRRLEAAGVGLGGYSMVAPMAQLLKRSTGSAARFSSFAVPDRQRLMAGR